MSDSESSDRRDEMSENEFSSGKSLKYFLFNSY